LSCGAAKINCLGDLPSTKDLLGVTRLLSFFSLVKLVKTAIFLCSLVQVFDVKIGTFSSEEGMFGSRFPLLVALLAAIDSVAGRSNASPPPPHLDFFAI